MSLHSLNVDTYTRLHNRLAMQIFPTCYLGMEAIANANIKLHVAPMRSGSTQEFIMSSQNCIIWLTALTFL